MEHDVVLADKVHEARVGAFPPQFPVVGPEILGVGDVADGRVKPHVEHFPLCPFHGHGDTPVEVAAHGTGFQAHVEPAFALSHHVAAPFCVVLRDPRLEPLLVLVERQIPVLRLFHHRHRAAHGALGVDEFLGRKSRAAFLALVAVGALCVAVGAFACDVAVGEEGLCLLVVVLLAFLLHKLALVVELAEEVGGRLAVRFARGASEHVERDAELFKRVLDDAVISVHNLLRRAAFLACADGDGHAVLVRAADVEHVLPFEAQVAHVDVGGDVHPGKVSYMHAAVGVGQGCRDEGAVEFLFHKYIV